MNIIEEMLKNIMDFSDSGILAINKQGIIIYTNHLTEKSCGIPEDSVGMNIQDYNPESKLYNVLKKGEISKNDIITRQGRKIVVNRIPIKYNNQIFGAVSIMQDLRKFEENDIEIRKNINDKGFKAKYTFDQIIGQCESIKKTIDTAKLYSLEDFPILINGESGTGKELFAQSIHNNSMRKDGPFVAINCANLPEGILESELFGYVEGAFTGAQRSGKDGLFVQSHKGTIFLDEIGELPIHLQSKLLRVIQEKEVFPIGSNKVIPIDTRIIAATNKKLFDEVEKGNFRLDLLYRINVLNLFLPPLKERKKDITSISVNYFISNHPKLYYSNQKRISEIISRLIEYSFPGNIRELNNILKRLSLFLSSELSKNNLDDIMNQLLDNSEKTDNMHMEKHFEGDILKRYEKDKIISLLIDNNGSRTEVARIMNINKSTLWRKMKKYDLL